MSDNSNKDSEWSKRELGALWRKGGNDNPFYSGSVTIDGQRHEIVIFKNKFKENGSNQPDLRIYKSQELQK